ncbi:hypothetical protein MKK64_23735 [Methylobacterium sp. E-025]|uniref:hypothetical protein n=1 Tax=Methylobacterium sp. E-025 TaxID=2836561 RepID=UPI001FBA61C0|nr:hypothetical protein [Methylobacterium sp. E-025]MCJ2114184.1 hypothetical protein [Methylobacterium sp. E-025]
MRSTTIPGDHGAALVELCQRHLGAEALAGRITIQATRVCGGHLDALQLAVRHKAMSLVEAAHHAAEALDLALTTGARSHVPG